MSTKNESKTTRDSSQRNKTAYSPLVTALVEDPDAPPSVNLVFGLPGPSTKDAHTRLYFGIDLGRWIDIPDEAILHIHAASDPNPLGIAVLWVRQDAKILPGWRGQPLPAQPTPKRPAEGASE